MTDGDQWDGIPREELEAMAELSRTEPRPTRVAAGSGVVVEVDVAEVLGALVPEYNPQYDEWTPGSPAGGFVVAEAAKLLAKALQPVVAEEIRASVRAKVDELVQATVDGGVQPADAWGQPRGSKTTLGDLVRQETNRYLTEPTEEIRGVRGQQRQTRLARTVRELVDTKFATDLAAAFDVARRELLARLQEQGAQVLGETIEKTLGVKP
jgi:hypothetical protein